MFIDVLSEVGTNYNNKQKIEKVRVNGILDRIEYDRDSLNGMRFSGCTAGIIRVASISTPVGEKFTAGELIVGVKPEYVERLIGRPVQVSNTKNSPLSIRKCYGKPFGKRTGVHAARMKPEGGKWIILSSFIKELTEPEVENLGLKNILIPGYDVAWNRIQGITAVPVFYGYECKPGKEIKLNIDPIKYTGDNENVTGEYADLVRGVNLTEDSDESSMVTEPLQFEKPEAKRGKSGKSEPQPLVHRSEIKPQSTLLLAAEDDNRIQKDKLINYESFLKEWSRKESSTLDNEIKNCIYCFRREYVDHVGRRTRNNDYTEDLVKKVLEKVNISIELNNRNSQNKKELIKVNDFIKLLKVKPTAWELELGLTYYKEFLFIISAIMDIDLFNIQEGVSESEGAKTLLNMLCRNPYKVGLLHGFTLEKADRAYTVIKLLESNNKGVSDLEDWATLSCDRDMLKMLDGLLNNDQGVTILDKDMLRVAYWEATKKLRKQGYKPWKARLIDRRLANIGLGNVSLYNFVKKLEISAINDRMVESLESKGLISQVDDRVILTSQYSRELDLYRKLYEMGSTPTGITENVIQEGVEQFEYEKGFKLEQLQKDGIGLVKYKAAVLSGCAGSGKTTVSEGMTKCIELGYQKMGKNVEILYAAPTGKAARRLAEVVQRPVKTLHSLFKIGIGGKQGYLNNSNKVKVSLEELDNLPELVFIFDEMAMADIDLLYKVIEMLPNNASVYFLGDVKQLNPIGKGIPFKDILDFLPAVELGVSKRSAEGSGINFNCNIMNQNSEQGGNWKNLENRDDFRLVECGDEKLQKSVISIAKHMLTDPKERKNWTPDDIQVVTPYADRGKSNSSRNWSSSMLNPKLQEVLNDNAALLTTGYGKNEITFRKDDRVIHVNTNKWNYKKYIKAEDNTFIEVEPLGVANGEMGKIKSYHHSIDVKIEELDRGTDYSGVTPRSDLEDIGIGTYFIEVEYYEPDLECNVSVLYHAKEKNVAESEERGKEFFLGDMENLDLAYALSTHKMQGSQSPVVIMPIGSKDNPTFVNRNMIYTAVSRASKKVIMVGSIKGSNSALNRGRMHSITEKDTLLRVLALT